MHNIPQAVIIMGVAGCGKTVVGTSLAEKLCCRFLEGDRFHPPENIEKMSKGVPLTDEDRRPWLLSLRNALENVRKEGDCVVAACSALKESYRKILTGGLPNVLYVHITGSFQLIQNRLKDRSGHYMKAGMLESQFEALEPPEYGLSIDAENPPDVIITEIERLMKTIYDGP